MRITSRTMIHSATVVWFFLTGVTGILASVWLATIYAWAAPDAPGAASYTEDFSIADRFRRDAVAESGLKVFPGLGLSSAAAHGGEVVYDLQKLLPGWTNGAIVVLTYDGAWSDVGSQMLGVHCDSGPAPDKLAEFSKAAYGKPVVVQGRYLRFRIAWQQTPGPEYGFLKSFAIRIGTPADVPIPISFTLDKPGVVTLVIDDADGNRVRNLISETPFEAGKHVVEWDGRDDHNPKRVSQQPVFRFEGEPVEPGAYTVRGLVRDPVHLRYEMPLYNAGNPPWVTADGRGGWLNDYVPPCAVLALPGNQMLLGSSCGESYGIVWTDLEGQRAAGVVGVGAANGGLGATVLARDAGPKADAAVTAYVGSAGDQTDLFEIFAMTQKPPTPAFNGGVRIMNANVWGAARPVYSMKVNGPDRRIYGLAARDMTVVASWTDKLLVIEDKTGPSFTHGVNAPVAPTGKVVAEVPLASPKGLAVTADGKHLLAVSGQRIVRFPFPPAGEPVVLVSEGLKDPSQLALDKDGNIYVSDAPTFDKHRRPAQALDKDGNLYVSDKSTHQVKVFTPEGKPLRTIGEPGGPRTGKYDPRRMAHPDGLAVSADGKLWVVENFDFPRRISIWTLDGTFVKGLYGNCTYGGGGELDTKDRSLAYISYYDGSMQFRLDWEKGTSVLESVYLGSEAKTALPGNPDYGRPFQHATYFKGRKYMSNSFSGGAGAAMGERVLSIWRIADDGAAVPVAAFGQADLWALLKEPRFQARYPEGQQDLGKLRFSWSGVNDDGQVAPEEVRFEVKNAGNVTLGEDMAITDSSGDRFVPVRFTAAGAPVYDLAQRVSVFPDAQGPVACGGGQVVDCGGGWAINTSFPYLRGAKDGKLRWRYPADSTGVHAGYESPMPSRTGQMLGNLRLTGAPFTPPGTQERLWAVLGTKGNIYVMTADGMFVATLFKDFRQAKAGPPTAERGVLLDDTSLGEDSFATCMGQSGDGKVYAVAGHPSTWIVRVDGLETIRRLPESEVVLTAERQEPLLNAGAVTPATHPRFPVETLADGGKRFVYQADFQKDKKAVDAFSSGKFADYPWDQQHCSGLYGEPTVFKFAMPGALTTIEATAVYLNSVDAAAHEYAIHYSFDGRDYKPLVEKPTGGPGDVKVDGKVEAPAAARRVWIKFAGLGNGRLALKQVSVALTYRETR